MDLFWILSHIIMVLFLYFPVSEQHGGEEKISGKIQVQRSVKLTFSTKKCDVIYMDGKLRVYWILWCPCFSKSLLLFGDQIFHLQTETVSHVQRFVFNPKREHKPCSTVRRFRFNTVLLGVVLWVPVPYLTACPTEICTKFNRIKTSCDLQ